MIKLSSENMVDFFHTCIMLDNVMTHTLEKWSSNIDINAVLEEIPYADENNAVLFVIEEDLRSTFEYADIFMTYKSMFADSETATPAVLIVNYFKSPAVEFLKRIIDTGASIDNEVIFELKGQYEKANLNLKHFMYKGFNLYDYPKGDGERVFEAYTTQYGDISDYVKSVVAFCEEHPMFYGESVNKHYDFFKNLLETHQEINSEDFTYACEAVMPWDVYLLKNGIIEFNNDYIKKLNNRLDNSASIFNSVPIIKDVIDKLPENLYKKMYDYEDLIGLASIEMIKDGKTTFEKVLADCDTIKYTSYF